MYNIFGHFGIPWLSLRVWLRWLEVKFCLSSLPWPKLSRAWEVACISSHLLHPYLVPFRFLLFNTLDYYNKKALLCMGYKRRVFAWILATYFLLFSHQNCNLHRVGSSLCFEVVTWLLVFTLCLPLVPNWLST